MRPAVGADSDVGEVGVVLSLDVDVAGEVWRIFVGFESSVDLPDRETRGPCEMVEVSKSPLRQERLRRVANLQR